MAYADGGTRQSFADAGRILTAKLPQRSDSRRFPQGALRDRPGIGGLYLSCGAYARKVYRMGTRNDRMGRSHQLRAFWFEAAVCGPCSLREQLDLTKA